MAASNGNLELVQLLLARGAKADERTPHSCTAVGMAALAGHAEVSDIILLRQSTLLYSKAHTLRTSALTSQPLRRQGTRLG